MCEKSHARIHTYTETEQSGTDMSLVANIINLAIVTPLGLQCLVANIKDQYATLLVSIV